MKFIVDILKEAQIMMLIKQLREPITRIAQCMPGLFPQNKTERFTRHPFWVMVDKEMMDHIRSWRFMILVAIVVLTCLGASYTALLNIAKAVKPGDADEAFLFLNLFTVSDGTLPSFVVFMGFLGPLLGIGMGFDAINSEQSRGTLSRILSQPIHRDYLINAKFVAALMVIALLVFVMGYLVAGVGLIAIGIPPTFEEFMRINLFLMLSVVYIAFWLNLSVLFSIRFRQAATSALSGIAVWLFFNLFYPLMLNIVLKPFTPSAYASPKSIYLFERSRYLLSQLMPNELFNEATSTLLMPTVRSVGPLTMQQVEGALPGPLPLGQSALLVWPQITGLLAATLICFALSYYLFVRREIRGRS
ncbi:MAG: ABC transporter permease [Marinilabiliaceae bacterium]|nr:ABC transporter permease [Marinilabiliaceae bacterium]